jgi:four helix bundle protein
MSELRVLSDLRELIARVYLLKFPEEEKFGLQSQIRRAVVSVSLNIREGNVFDKANKLRFFMIALGSLQEVDECFEIMKHLGFISEASFNEYRDNHYWKILNSLKSLIDSIHSRGKQ